MTVCATLRADIMINNPAAADHTAFSFCPAADGANVLDPDPATHLAPPQAGQGVLAELANGNTKFPGWTFNAGAALNGMLTIDHYHSHFFGTHYSGCQFQATYAPAAGDPGTLRFVQMIETSDPAEDGKGHQATSPYIDPYPNDDDLPFYYTEKETKEWGNVFNDNPKRDHPPTSFVTWRGNLYLTSWDGKNPGVVTVHDGVRYGFDAGCITFYLLTVALDLPLNLNTVTLTWPTNAPGTEVQSTASLVDQVSWSAITNPINTSNGQYTVTLARQPYQQFFRLFHSLTNPVPPPHPQPASVSLPPRTQTVAQSHEAYFSVKTDGTPPIGYQWFFNHAPILNATNRELDFPHVQYTNQGMYYAVVSNAAGMDTSAMAQLTVIQDTNPPTLVSVVASSNRLQIIVTYSEGVTPITATNRSNYQLQQSNPPAGPVPIINAFQGTDESVVILAPLAPLTPNAQFFIGVGNITDLATPPNVISPNPTFSTFSTGP
jgi:hypothetical protein